VLKQVQPEAEITDKAMRVMCDFVYDMFKQIILEAENLCRMRRSKSLTVREIQTSIRLILPGELAKHSVSEGTKAVTKYAAKGASKLSDAASVAGLSFPIGKIYSLMKDHWLSSVGITAAVYAAAVLEYLSAEILELSGKCAKDLETIEITPRHIMLSIRNDEELDRITRRSIIPDCGMIPHIHSAILPYHHKRDEDAGTGDEPGTAASQVY